MPEFARFDPRHYPTVSAKEGYGEWTPTYEDTVEDAMDLALLDRIQHVNWPELERVADLGCGTGRTGAWLRAHCGCPIDGVDLTPEMLAVARQRGIYDQLAESDVARSGLPTRTYDLVTCCLVDEHLADLEPLYAEAARILQPSGHFSLVGYHPYFIMKTGMPTHFEHPARGNIALEMHVHLFSDHARAASAAGFVGIELHEALVDEHWIERKPKWQELRDWPISFAAVWRLDR